MTVVNKNLQQPLEKGPPELPLLARAEILPSAEARLRTPKPPPETVPPTSDTATDAAPAAERERDKKTGVAPPPAVSHMKPLAPKPGPLGLLGLKRRPLDFVGSLRCSKSGGTTGPRKVIRTVVQLR